VSGRKRLAAAGRRALRKAARGHLLARVFTSPGTKYCSYMVEGYVVGLSHEWVLLNKVNGDTMRANGYSAARVKDVQMASLLRDRQDDFVGRALALRGIQAVPQPDILLGDLPSLLSSTNTHSPLVTIHVKRKCLDLGGCFIGRVDQIKKERLVLREMDRTARWSRMRRLKMKHITHIEFGGGYEQALWQVSEHDRQTAQSRDEQP